MKTVPEDQLPLLLPEVDADQAIGHRRIAACERDGVGEYDRSGNGHEGAPRDEYDAAMGGQLLVLPAFHRSA